MSDTDAAALAFASAEAEIERVIAAGETELDFDNSQYRSLRELPRQIGRVPGLWRINLCNTQVADIGWLTGVSELQHLNLAKTKVAEIDALSSCSLLESLYLNDTQVRELGPLAHLTRLQRLYGRNTLVSDIIPLTRISELRIIDFSATAVVDISPVANLEGLEGLFLDNTQVADIAPLAKLKSLKRLSLDNTKVADIAPLAELTNLAVLNLRNTPVSDLRCLGHIEGLLPQRDAVWGGLEFSGSLATRNDPELKRLSETPDRHERTGQTQTYLRTLPPPPEPLPWRAPETVAPPPLPDPPEVFGLPEVRVTAEGIDVAPGTATEADLADPIKAQLYAQLGGLAEALFQKGNRYPELSDPARALRELTSGPFEAASILGIHLQLSALDDIRKEDANRPEAEQMDSDCRLAIGQVLRHGPGITMGHPDVVLVEARNAEFAGQPVPETEAESERRLARTVADAQVPATKAAQQVAGALATSQSKGRLSQARRVLAWGLVSGVGALVVGGLGQAGADGYQWAVEWISANRDAIWTAAQGWGSTFVSWVRDLLTTVLGPKGPGGTLL